MAVQSDTSRIQYAGNNSTTTSYAVPFVFQENSHLKAIARTSAGVESVVTLTNHTGAGNVNGGTVRTSVAIPTTSTLTIYREVPATQTTTYAEGGDFPAASHERALDKLTYLVQQLGRAVARCVRLTDAAPESAAIPAVANQFFGTDANGAIVMVAGVNAAPESITNLSISPTAAIAGTKIAPNFGSQNVVTTGSVGIGTTSPTRTLHVNSGTTDFVARFESTDSGAEIVLQDDASTNEGNRIGVVGNDFRITTNNTERMRIDASGNVGIGTTSPAYTLHVNGSVAGTSAYNNLSDVREKENIAYGIADALETVKALKPAKFDFKTGEKNKIGFIAQDVLPLVPEVITSYKKTLEDDTKEERLSIQESSLTAVLVAAVQELTAKVEALEAAQ
jgi:hypothetical protein